KVAPGVRRFVRDHINDVEAVLNRAIEVGLTFSGHKSTFGLREITVVGFTCDHRGRLPGALKVSAIERMGACRSFSEVRRFLGAVGFYRYFIPHYADVAEPLYDLLQKSVAWAWTPRCTGAMRDLQARLQCAPVLRPISYAAGAGQIYLTVDASPRAVGWVFSQDPDGQHQPTRFGLLAVKVALSEQRQSVLGRHVDVETDCQALFGMMA
ncbi:MAG: hypothetical protein BJ554DRAFT_5013, partial [Olpidium bornovanus]